MPLDNIPNKSSLEDDSLDHNVAARLISEGGNHTGITFNSSSVSEQELIIFRWLILCDVRNELFVTIFCGMDIQSQVEFVG